MGKRENQVELQSKLGTSTSCIKQLGAAASSEKEKPEKLQKRSTLTPE